MTMSHLSRIAGLAAITIFAAVVTGIAGAELNWSNQITIHPDGMEWQYTEELSDMDSYSFTYDIDYMQGDKDQFVSTWELMKTDRIKRERLRYAIEREMDVKIDNSSDGIDVLDIDTSLSNNALGPVNNTTELTNIYRVTYSFLVGLLENSSTIWLLGEPGSFMSVHFPEGTQIIMTKGIENVSINGSYLTGSFTRSNWSIKAAESEGVADNDRSGAKGAEITYTIDIVRSQQHNLSEESYENKTALPASTEIPFPGTLYLLLVIASAVLLSKD